MVPASSPSGFSAALAKFLAWFQRQTKPAQGCLGCLGLIVLLVVCGSCIGIAQGIAGGGKSSANAGQQTTQQQQQQPTNTAGPTATPKPTATATATPKPKTWQSVYHKEGSGNTQTDVFQIKNGDHVVVSCTGSEPDLLIVDLYKQGESYGQNFPYAQVVDFANQDCGAPTTYTIQQRDASVYFRVEADSVHWVLDVQRLQ